MKKIVYAIIGLVISISSITKEQKVPKKDSAKTLKKVLINTA